MVAERTTQAVRLRVRRRLVIGGNGESSIVTIVPCSRQGGPVPLTTCMGCEHGGGVENDANGRRSHVLCHDAPEALAPQFSPAIRRAPSPAGHTTVAAVMTSNVICVREDVRIEALTKLLQDRCIRSVPVVDEDGFPAGIVSKTDLFVATSGKAADIMTCVAFTIDERSPLSAAAALMALEGVHQLPVVSNVGKVVGILSSLDVLRWLAQHDGYLVS